MAQVKRLNRDVITYINFVVDNNPAGALKNLLKSGVKLQEGVTLKEGYIFLVQRNFSQGIKALKTVPYNSKAKNYTTAPATHLLWKKIKEQTKR